MTLLQAAILGAVQGATEFIPVSSTGHLILIPWILGWKDPGLTFDLAAHVGTLAALLWVFWHDWVAIYASLGRCLINRWRCDSATRQAGLVGVWIILASVPAAIFGYLFNDVVEQNLRNPLFIAATTFIVAFVMLTADKLGRRTRSWGEAGLKDWMAIGFAQVAALMPGVSRSGITISEGLALGFERAAAARLSFLLSAPIIAGAAAVHLKDAVHGSVLPPGEFQAFLVAGLTAAIVGYLCIRFLLGYLQKHGLAPFVWYRVALAILIVALALRGG